MLNDKDVVVFDTNTLLQAVASARGPAVKCLEYFDQGKTHIAVSSMESLLCQS